MLRHIAPTIVQDIKYAGPDNFTGRAVPGYGAGECLLLRPVAEALAKVQRDLRTKQLSLKVYDCYRPIRAVRAFMTWSEQPEIGTTKRFYPRLEKRALVSSGYIARQSGHSRGDTVDVGLVSDMHQPTPPFDPS